MIEKIKYDLGSAVNVYCVNSVAEKKRTGALLAQFGKESILKNIVEMLLENTARRISSEYAEQLRAGLFELINKRKKEYFNQIDSCRWFDLVQSIPPEFSSSKFVEETVKFINNMNNHYEEKIQAFLEMYCSFANALWSQQIKQCTPYAFSYNVLLDETLDDDLLEWFKTKQKELEKKIISVYLMLSKITKIITCILGRYIKSP